MRCIHCQCQQNYHLKRTTLCNVIKVDVANDITGIIGVAHTVAEQILAKWHKDSDEVVSEGETYNEYANILVPQVKMDAEKIALKLVELCKVNFDELPKNTSIGLQERKGEDISRKIVYSTQVTKPIEVIAYHNADNAADSQSTTDSSTTSESIPGTAVKTGLQTWTVFFQNEELIS